jgi:hypothetical protein
MQMVCRTPHNRRLNPRRHIRISQGFTMIREKLDTKSTFEGRWGDVLNDFVFMEANLLPRRLERVD